MIDLISALNYLHNEKKIIHRDLNPANILINSSFNVKLTDFGLAKQVTQSVSVMNSFVGTLAYSCPELVQNQKYSEKADVWSLGCILYELVMMKTPFYSNNPLNLAKKVQFLLLFFLFEIFKKFEIFFKKYMIPKNFFYSIKFFIFFFNQKKNYFSISIFF